MIPPSDVDQTGTLSPGRHRGKNHVPARALVRRLLCLPLVAAASVLLVSCNEPKTEEPGPPPGTFAIVDLSGGPQAASYPVEFASELPAGFPGEEHKTTKLVLRWIKPAKFKMGQLPFAAPVHPVSLTRGYYVGLLEVTQAQWEQVMGPTKFHFEGNPTFPAESVSWEDIRGRTDSHDWPNDSGVAADSFMGRLSDKTQPALRFDLPTEAQWELACRAGTTTPWSFDDTAEDIDDFVWSDDNGDESPNEVGTLEPNPWGLYDVHGNVEEWCRDRYGRYPHESQVDPSGPTNGWNRVWRGGGWDITSYLSQSAVRNGGLPSNRYPNVGFRPVAVPLTP